jgi:hypothetical protein
VPAAASSSLASSSANTQPAVRSAATVAGNASASGLVGIEAFHGDGGSRIANLQQPKQARRLR